MLGEISLRVRELRAELEELEDDREMFVMANDETMPRFLYNKKLAEIDRHIEEIRDSLRSAEDEYREIVEDESRGY